MIVTLTASDLEEIMSLEEAAFDPSLRASSQTYSDRFDLGHSMLGFRVRGRLTGIVGFSHGCFDPYRLDLFPRDFKAWSLQPVPNDANATFIYNLGVEPGLRGSTIARDLVRAALQVARENNALRVVGEGPVPSYNGTRSIKPNARLKARLDRGPMLISDNEQELFFSDPNLALYRKIIDCRALCALPNFLPSDQASGGYRVMLYRHLGIS